MRQTIEHAPILLWSTREDTTQGATGRQAVKTSCRRIGHSSSLPSRGCLAMLRSLVLSIPGSLQQDINWGFYYKSAPFLNLAFETSTDARRVVHRLSECFEISGWTFFAVGGAFSCSFWRRSSPGAICHGCEPNQERLCSLARTGKLQCEGKFDGVIQSAVTLMQDVTILFADDWLHHQS